MIDGYVLGGAAGGAINFLCNEAANSRVVPEVMNSSYLHDSSRLGQRDKHYLPRMCYRFGKAVLLAFFVVARVPSCNA